MAAREGKISCRQAVLLFIMLVYSPAIRLFPHFTAHFAKNAAWVTPVVSSAGFIVIVLIFHKLFEKNKEKSLSDIFYSIMGSLLGKAIVGLYLLWSMFLLSTYIRYYAERILISFIPEIPISILTVTILIIAYICVRNGIVALARFSEFFFYVFSAIFLILFFVVMPEIKLMNILPVSYADFLPILKSSYVIISPWGYFIFVFFMGDKINDKDNIKKFGLQAAVYLVIAAVMIIIQTIGVMGYRVAGKTFLPYFITIKHISILGIIEHLESVVMSLWLIVDFIIISFFATVSVNIAKSLFKLSDIKTAVAPFLLFAYMFSLYLAKNMFELENLSSYIILPVNLVFVFILPMLLLIIGKIRKMI